MDRRETFTIPYGMKAVRGADGRATGATTYDVTLGASFTLPPALPSALQHKPIESVEWELVIGKSGTYWLYDPEGSDCYCSSAPGYRGFGGSPVTFPRKEGLSTILLGPWHSNTHALFADTGIDRRDQHLTWGCVGTGRDFDGNLGRDRLTGIVWFDPEPTRGEFERVWRHAVELEREIGVPLFYMRVSAGGSECGRL